MQMAACPFRFGDPVSLQFGLILREDVRHEADIELTGTGMSIQFKNASTSPTRRAGGECNASHRRWFCSALLKDQRCRSDCSHVTPCYPSGLRPTTTTAEASAQIPDTKTFHRKRTPLPARVDPGSAQLHQQSCPLSLCRLTAPCIPNPLHVPSPTP
jgi:hypothetical protein